MQLTVDQLFHYGDPGFVELTGRRRRAAPRNPVRLLHERNAHAGRDSDLACADEIRRRHPATRTMAEPERRARRICRPKVNAGKPVRGVQLEHVGILAHGVTIETWSARRTTAEDGPSPQRSTGPSTSLPTGSF